MNDLKLFAKTYILENELSEKDSTYLLDFVDKSNDNDILNLLFTGNPQKVSEHKAKKLNEQYEESGLKYIIEAIGLYTLDAGSVPMTTVAKAFWRLAQKVTGKKPFATYKDLELWLSRADAQQVEVMMGNLLAGAATISIIAFISILTFIGKRFIKQNLSKAAIACNSLEGRMKTICMNKFSIKMLEAQIKILKNGKSACSKTKKPAFCSAKIDAKAHAYESKIRKYEMDNKKLETKIKT